MAAADASEWSSRMSLPAQQRSPEAIVCPLCKAGGALNNNSHPCTCMLRPTGSQRRLLQAQLQRVEGGAAGAHSRLWHAAAPVATRARAHKAPPGGAQLPGVVDGVAALPLGLVHCGGHLRMRRVIRGGGFPDLVQHAHSRNCAYRPLRCSSLRAAAWPGDGLRCQAVHPCRGCTVTACRRKACLPGTLLSEAWRPAGCPHRAPLSHST